MQSGDRPELDIGLGSDSDIDYAIVRLRTLECFDCLNPQARLANQSQRRRRFANDIVAAAAQRQGAFDGVPRRSDYDWPA
jgi:hypothetical protein